MKIKLLVISAFASCSAMMCSSCGRTPNNPEASHFVCSSSAQEYGEYNLEMEHFKLRDKSNVEFALKLNDGVMKIFNVKNNHMWMEDSVRFHHENNGLYYFESTVSEHVG